MGEEDFGSKGAAGRSEEDEDDEGEGDERETVHSLPPPPSTNVTWEDYITAPDGE